MKPLLLQSALLEASAEAIADPSQLPSEVAQVAGKLTEAETERLIELKQENAGLEDQYEAIRSQQASISTAEAQAEIRKVQANARKEVKAAYRGADDEDDARLIEDGIEADAQETIRRINLDSPFGPDMLEGDIDANNDAQIEIINRGIKRLIRTPSTYR